jgi:hypothetical protein
MSEKKKDSVKKKFSADFTGLLYFLVNERLCDVGTLTRGWVRAPRRR